MKIIPRLLGLLLPSWRMVALGILLSLVALLANLGLLALSSWFIASMAIAGSLGAVMDYTTPAAAVRALALFRAGGRYAERLVNHDTTLRVLSTLRVWFFRRIEPLAPARLSAHRSGDLLSRVRADVDTLDDFYVRGVVPTAVAVLGCGCIVPFLAFFDPRLACIDLAGLAFAGVLLPLLLRRLAAAPGRKRVELSAELRASIVEQAQGMAELVALGAVGEREARLAQASHDLDRQQRKLSSLQGIGEAGLSAASSLAVWAAVLVTAPLVLAGARGGAQLAMLTVFVLATFESVMPLPAVIQRAGEIAAAARRLFELIDVHPAAAEPTDPAPPPGPGTRLGLSIRDLGFRYAPDQRWIIDGLSVQVPAGAKIGIAGPTGIGKSTLVSLLLRFWGYEMGSIAVVDDSGHSWDLSTLRGDDARRLFSVMQQSPHLFHASLRENLLLAIPHETRVDDDTLLDALRTAQLSGFLAALPEGMETTVGETGRELSGGEARRVALARALLKDAPIYVLDEPTEGLDEATADGLMKAVADRLRGRTLIVISHRDQDLSVVDRVVRMSPHT
jgi:ATP-binding cassette subfamily C protein CydC